MQTRKQQKDYYVKDNYLYELTQNNKARFTQVQLNQYTVYLLS